MIRYSLLGATFAFVASASVQAQAASPHPASSSAGMPFFEITVMSQPSEIRTAISGVTSARSVAMRGAQLTLLSRSAGMGLVGRILQSPIGSSDLNSIEGGLVVGAPAFMLEGAYVMRSGFSAGTALPFDSTHAFARAGLRLRARLGNTGFALRMRLGYYIPIKSKTLEGWEGESGVTWTWDRIPLTAAVGYRLERFVVSGVEQEVSAVSLGVGIILDRR